MNLTKLSKSTLIRIIESGFSVDKLDNSEIEYLKNLQKDIKKKLKKIKIEKLREIIKQYISHEFVNFIEKIKFNYERFTMDVEYDDHYFGIMIYKDDVNICEYNCWENFLDVKNELQDHLDILTNNYDSIRTKMKNLIDELEK